MDAFVARLSIKPSWDMKRNDKYIKSQPKFNIAVDAVLQGAHLALHFALLVGSD